MKVTLTQGAVLNGKLKGPGEQELNAEDTKKAKALGIVKGATDEKSEAAPKDDAKKKAE